MPTYQGNKRIADALEYRALDEHLRRMAAFEQVFIEEMGGAVGEAVAIGREHAKENIEAFTSDLATGQLKGSVFGRMLSVLKGTLTVRGAIGAQAVPGIKGFVLETGRWYSNRAERRRHYWKGKFYLYYGVVDREKEIMALYETANARIVSRLVVKA